jgi:hypothetical protein
MNNTRAAILEEAGKCVNVDRKKTHGPPENSFQKIADLWTAYLGEGSKISATDVTVMMGLLKVARIRHAPHNKDNWVDIAGYAACGGELALKTPEVEQENSPYKVKPGVHKFAAVDVHPDSDGWTPWSEGDLHNTKLTQ